MRQEDVLPFLADESVIVNDVALGIPPLARYMAVCCIRPPAGVPCLGKAAKEGEPRYANAYRVEPAERTEKPS